MNLLDPLLAKAKEIGDSPCIRGTTLSLSYRQFFSRVLSLAGALADAGVRPGQVVAHRFDNELLSLIAMLATARLGATLFSVPASMPPLRRDNLLQAVDASALITDTPGLTYDGLETLRVTADMLGFSPLLPAPPTGDPSAPWVIVTGSGSTGHPKLMPVSHTQQIARMTTGGEWLPYRADDCLASLIHLDFYASKQRYLEAFTLGASIFLGHRRQLDYSEDISRGAISALYGTVFHVEQLLDSLSVEALSHYQSLNALMIGGSTVSTKLREAIRERLTSKLYILYGANESHTACISRLSEVYTATGAVGRPFPSTQLEIVDADDSNLPTGTPGQIRLKTPGMIEGYLDDAPASAQFFRQGWFYPGDIGTRTADGQLIHLGRADNMMIMNGINIYPAEIEQLMLAHPDVTDAMAGPLSHRIHQHVPVCLVVLEKNINIRESELLAYARARLGSSAPHRVYVVEQVPRNEQGKPLMTEISKLIEKQTHKQPRQLTREFPLVFTAPAKINLALFDNWIQGLHADDISSRLPPDQSAVSAPLGTAEWLWRCLLLARTLMQAATMPIFDPPQILSCEGRPGQRNQFLAKVTFPAIDNYPPQAYQRVLSQTFSVAQWMTAHQITPANRKHIFDHIQSRILKPVMATLGQGKSTLPLLQGAHTRGIPFRHLGHGVYQLGWGAKAVCFDRSTSENDSAIGMRLSNNKLTTAELSRSAGLPAPRHRSVANFEDAKQAADNIGWPVVVKPVDGERGEGVTVAVDNEASLQRAFNHAMDLSIRKGVIVEQQVSGVCHRLFIANNQLLYAVKRLPMSVTADGKSTIAQLITASLVHESTLPPWLRSELRPLDELALTSLERAGFTPQSVPTAGIRAPLRPIETTQWGGVDEEVTGIVHPDNLRIALDAASLFRLQVAGIDIITPDISIPWYENGAIINEVNYSPLLGGGEISRRCIPEYLSRLVDGDGTIPVEVYMGGESAWQKARARHTALLETGLNAYLSNNQCTLTPTEESLFLNADGLHGRVRALTLSRDVAYLILVVQNDELLHRGYPTEWIDKVEVVDEHIDNSEAPGQPLSQQAVERLVQFMKQWVKP